MTAIPVLQDRGDPHHGERPAGAVRQTSPDLAGMKRGILRYRGKSVTSFASFLAMRNGEGKDALPLTGRHDAAACAR
jgi:hypothetical protein